MVFTINNINMLNYLDADGFKWSVNDLDSEEAGRTLDGVMHRGRVATKRKLELTCKPLTTQQAKVVLNAIMPEFVNVIVTDPLAGGNVSLTMYCSARPANLRTIYDNGVELWNGIAFNLIER